MSDDVIDPNERPAPSAPARVTRPDAPLEPPAADRSGPNLLPGPAAALPADPVLAPPPPSSQAEPLMAQHPVAGRAPDASLIPTAEPDRHAAYQAAPPSGGYRALTAAILLFLVLLLAGAIALIVYLTTNSGLPSFGLELVQAVAPPLSS